MRAPRVLAIAPLVVAIGCGSATPSARPEPASPPMSASASEPNVALGECDVAWLPPGTVVDLAPEDAESLAAAMRTWLATGARELRIETRRGIAFAKSADDLGADPPHPTSTRAQSTLACGVESGWLADHVHASFARAASPDFGGVTCQDNVCCYAGMEYVSRGIAIARRDTSDGNPIWVLDAFVEVAEAALSPEVVRANRESVAAALERERRGTCRGEPAGHR